jgi:hypothetical protein
LFLYFGPLADSSLLFLLFWILELLIIIDF